MLENSKAKLVCLTPNMKLPGDAMLLVHAPNIASVLPDVHLLHHFVLLWPQLSLVKRSQQKGSMEDEMGKIALQTFKTCQSSLMLLSFRNTGTESTRLNVRLSTKKVLRTTWTRKGHFYVLIVLQIKVKFYQLFLSQFHSDIHRLLIKTKPENMIFQEVW